MIKKQRTLTDNDIRMAVQKLRENEKPVYNGNYWFLGDRFLILFKTVASLN